MRNVLIAAVVVILIVLVVVIPGRNNENIGSPPTGTEQVFDPQNSTFIIQDTPVTLVDGVAEQSFEEFATTPVTTRYFGHSLETDLTGDGREDLVFLVTQNSGGSGTFFYVVALLNTESGQIGSDGFLLGDRIAPQTIEISQNPNHQNVVVVNYADRAPDEPLATVPSIARSLYLKLDEDNHWALVDAEYAGAADPERMTLTMKTWAWQRTDHSDGRTITPDQSDVFTLIFAEDGSVAIGTDCNSVGGQYEAESGQLSFSELRMTLMYCEDSQEEEFVSTLREISSYEFTTQGELILQQGAAEVVMVFR